MRQVVKDVIEYVTTGRQATLLQAPCAQWGEIEVRLFCIKLCSWWARRTLMQSRHPYLSLSPSYPWHASFRAFVESMPELQNLVDFRVHACHFANNVELEERREINDYAQQHYLPTLFGKPSTA